MEMQAPPSREGPHDCPELLGLERSSADERAVDAVGSRKFTDAGGRDAAAVENGRPVAWEAGGLERATDHAGGSSRMRGGRGTPGADRPDRLVGDDKLRRALAIRAQRRDSGGDLPRDDRFRFARQVLRLAFADAEHHAQPGGDRARELARHADVVVAEVAAYL